ncbi:MAG TPA: hypothetical protein V6C57_16370 [Coleofasciculaceae cyanobacterium]
MIKGQRLEIRRLSRAVAKGLALSLLGFPIPAFAFSIAPPSETIAQLNPNPSIFSEPPFNRVPRPQVPGSQPAPTSPPTPSTSPLVPPDTVMTPVNGQVSIRFVNQTGAAINYQVIDTTQYRTLAGQSEITLQGLAVPTTLTFRRQDKGLLRVTLAENQPAPGTLTLTVQETTDFAADRTSVYIDAKGGVFLN